VVKPLIVAAALLLSAAGARADGPLKAMSFGDGGGYVHPDPATQQFLDGPGQNSPSTDAPAPNAPTPAPAPASVPTPAPAAAPTPAAGATTPPPIATRPPAAGAPSNASAPRGLRNETMFNGVVRPLAVAPGVTSDDPEDARAAADSDYSARVLGQASALRGPKIAGPGPVAAAANVPHALAAGTSPAGAPAAGGRLFVSFEIDPKEAGTLRDAVAGLGASAGFAQDMRFDASSGPDGIARVAGWIPAARLGDALRRPGVKSVRVDSARPAPSSASSGLYLVGLRLPDPARAKEQVESSLRDMAATVGFRATRVVGVEAAPDGSSVALIEGRLPLTNLPAALGRSDVVRIEPLLPAPAAAAPAEKTAGGLSGFAHFAVQRGLWLILLTLLVALPSLRTGAVRLAGIFNPYR